MIPFTTLYRNFKSIIFLLVARLFIFKVPNKGLYGVWRWHIALGGYKAKEAILYTFKALDIGIYRGWPWQIIELYSRIERISEKYSVLRVKSLHVLLIDASIDDDFLEIVR